MSKKEVIFTIDDSKEEVLEKTTSVYTFYGEHDFEDEDGYPRLEDCEECMDMSDAYAIKVEMGKRTQYYVKRGKYGKLYNPIGMYSEGTSGAQMRHAGKPLWQFSVTNVHAFNLYTKFLKTKNTLWLNKAEREV